MLTEDDIKKIEDIFKQNSNISIDKFYRILERNRLLEKELEDKEKLLKSIDKKINDYFRSIKAKMSSGVRATLTARNIEGYKENTIIVPPFYLMWIE